MVGVSDPDRAEQGRYPTGEDHPLYVSREEVLDDIIAGRVFLGIWPNSEDYRAFGEHAMQTIWKKFGGWKEAVDAAKERFEETSDEWPIPEDDVRGSP